MEGKSASFWFSIMDVDGDERLSIQDLFALQSCKDNDKLNYKYETIFIYMNKDIITRITRLDIERSWIALCDRCNSSPSSTLSLRDILKRGHASAFCFKHFILQT